MTTFVDSVRKLKVRETPAHLQRELDMDPAILASEFVELLAGESRMNITVPRASSIYDSCVRFHVLATYYKIVKVEKASFKGRLIYGIGNAVHFWAQNSVDVFGNKRRGWWKCLACGTVRSIFGPPPKTKCPKCDAAAEASIYYEHQMKVPGVDVSGHPDMFVERVANLNRVVEIKTITASEFIKLKAPFAPHEYQAQTYMWGCSQDKSIPIPIDPEIGYVVYVSKGGAEVGFPLKMFPVERNPTIIKEIKAKCQVYSDGLKGFPKRLPPAATACKDSQFTKSTAKYCLALKQCVQHFKGGSK